MRNKIKIIQIISFVTFGILPCSPLMGFSFGNLKPPTPIEQVDDYWISGVDMSLAELRRVYPNMQSYYDNLMSEANRLGATHVVLDGVDTSGGTQWFKFDIGRVNASGNFVRLKQMYSPNTAGVGAFDDYRQVVGGGSIVKGGTIPVYSSGSVAGFTIVSRTGSGGRRSTSTEVNSMAAGTIIGYIHLDAIATAFPTNPVVDMSLSMAEDSNRAVVAYSPQ